VLWSLKPVEAIGWEFFTLVAGRTEIESRKDGWEKMAARETKIVPRGHRKAGARRGPWEKG